MESEEREPLMLSDNETEEVITQTVPSNQPSKQRTILLKIVFVLANLLSNVGLYASTPIYTTVMTDVSDIYSLLIISGFFCPVLLALAWIVQQLLILREPLYFVCMTPWKTLVLCGFLSTVQNIIVILATLPTRTPSYLYPLLNTAIIPITAVTRFLILRKALSVRQVICCGVVILGIFVSAAPTIFSLKLRDDDDNDNNTLSKSGKNGTTGDEPQTPSVPFLWPMLMILAQIPVAINYVIYETSAQRRTKELLVFYFWAQLFGFLWVLVLFWSDIIPGFGQASSVEDFFLKLNQALACHFGIINSSARGCEKVPLIFVLNTFAYVGADVFLICLMAVSEGSVFSTLVSSLSLPLSSFFWMLFKYEEKILALIWDPIINYTALFPVFGLVLLIPSTIYYEMSSLSTS